jgi:hypothetical protein
MSPIPAAFPFIEVTIDTSALQPVAQRAPGVIAVVGKTPNGAAGGTAAANTPLVVGTLDEAGDLFARRDANDNIVETSLFSSLALALLQDPKPSKIYGVRVAGNDYAAALGGLEAADDVTFVSLANEPGVGAAAGNNPPTNLHALKAHVENMSAEGQKRIGFAMLDPATAKSPTYVADVATAVASLKSDTSRMVMIAARGAVGDAATAAMAAIAGYEPHVSAVLKRVRGVSIPLAQQYGPAEIKGLSEQNIDPIIDPALVVGTSLHFAEGRTFTTDESLLNMDTVRSIDHIESRLKAGLVGAVGDARITKAGLTQIQTRTEGIIGPLKRRGVIDDFTIRIPVLDILGIPETARTPSDTNEVQTARQNRTVDMLVTLELGPTVHQLLVRVAPTF